MRNMVLACLGVFCAAALHVHDFRWVLLIRNRVLLTYTKWKPFILAYIPFRLCWLLMTFWVHGFTTLWPNPKIWKCLIHIINNNICPLCGRLFIVRKLSIVKNLIVKHSRLQNFVRFKPNRKAKSKKNIIKYFTTRFKTKDTHYSISSEWK